MKRRVVFVVIFLALCNCTYAQWWKKLGGAILGGVADKYIRQCGYTPQESREIISNVTSALGGNVDNVECGIDFLASDKKGQINMAVDAALETTGELTGQQNITNQIKKGVDAGFAVSKADNEYDKANIIAGTAMDVVGDLTKGHDVTNKISAYVDANMTYLSDVSKAETVEELQKAAGKKKQAYSDLIVDIGMGLYDRKVAKEKAASQERENNHESGNFPGMLPNFTENDWKSDQQISERAQEDDIQEEEKGQNGTKQVEQVEKREVFGDNDGTKQSSVLEDREQDGKVSEMDVRPTLVDGQAEQISTCEDSVVSANLLSDGNVLENTSQKEDSFLNGTEDSTLTSTKNVAFRGDAIYNLFSSEERAEEDLQRRKRIEELKKELARLENRINELKKAALTEDK